MGGGGEVRIRYAPYLEFTHSHALPAAVVDFEAVVNKSPYATGYTPITPERGFFGVIEGDPTRNYRLEDFPSLWDMFGKFIGGLDLHLLWSDVYEDVTHGPEIANAISAHSAILRDEIDQKLLPQFLAGMRDINAIQSSAFIIGKSLIYDGHTKAVNEFAGNLRIAALDLSYKIWFKHLDWSSGVIGTYHELFKSYFVTKFDNDARDLDYKAKHERWNTDRYEFFRAFLGALNGAAATAQKPEPSQLMKSVGGALSGAAAGAPAGPYGAAAGAVLGLGASFMS